MSERIIAGSGAPGKVGSAIRGRFASIATYVAGTTATGADGAIVGGADPYLQTRQALANIAAALEARRSASEDVVRTRIYGSTSPSGRPSAAPTARCSPPSGR
jgi:enamine deaminase RidA (YjgF/YER057c/UK114 family)